MTSQEALASVDIALSELRTMVNNTSSWNASGFREVWCKKLDAAHQAARDLQKACQRAICNCHDLAADPHAPTLMRHDTIKECVRFIVAEEREMENEACAKAALCEYSAVRVPTTPESKHEAGCRDAYVAIQARIEAKDA